ncbi:hypothetical protein CR513_11142, partial [Mucuna pruriens]
MLIKQILQMLEDEEAGKGLSNSGSFDNYVSGSRGESKMTRPLIKPAVINSGQNAGNRNRYHTSNHHGERIVNNSGNFHGNGNGGFVEGGFDASTRNYYGGRHYLILAMIEAEEAAGKGGSSDNYGTSGSFNNHGGPQDFSNAAINSGQNSGNRNRYHTSNHHGERTVNNSGNFHGNGNSGFVEGGFDASTRNFHGGHNFINRAPTFNEDYNYGKE